MVDTDVPEVVALWDHAFQSLYARLGLPVGPATPDDLTRLQNRVRPPYAVPDPTGSWVAEQAGTIVGLAQSLVRGEYWVLSLLATAPDFQGRGLGRQLMERAMANTERRCPGTIQASRDPAALALYTSSGFDLHPVVHAHGTVRPGRFGLIQGCMKSTTTESSWSTPSTARSATPPEARTSAP